MCTTEDYDSPAFYSDRLRLAKKNHKCSECQSTIEPKEHYKYAIGKWEGQVSAFKTCRFCLKAQNWLFDECRGFMHGGLEVEIEEHACEYQKIFLYRWLIGIRTQWHHEKRIKQ